MKIEKVSEEFAADCFRQGIDCSQIVLGYAANKVGMESDEALRISSPFGGGMWAGRTCGCVVGGLMALGMKYGYSEPGATEQKKALLAKKAEFEQKFAEENKSVVCKEILGYDLSKPEEMQQVIEKSLFYSICPKVVCSACKILDGLM
ncbi:MAG: C-GCAxxG-C-C family protein [Bacteroidales bacterium]|jgi:C_GCAxxG_C_C family probable redox protein|nr:C-GCAxxG-C-C family protein [Bacteroidales bacterium]